MKHFATPLAILPLLLLLGATPGKAGVIRIDFEAFPLGDQPLDFLAPYGVSNITISGAPGAGPPCIYEGVFPIIPPSPTKVMCQNGPHDTGQPHRLHFEFSQPLTAFALSRIGTGEFNSSIPAWSASFYDANNTLLGSFGEPYTVAQLPVRVFTFEAPAGRTIARMVLESVWWASTFRNIPVDDFVLTTASGPVGDLFGPPTGFATGTTPAAVASADLNGDGRPDLVVSDNESNYVSVLLGHGDGTFAPKADYPIPRVGSGNIGVGDLNSDGHLDLALTIFGDPQGDVAVLMGTGDGGFGPASLLQVGLHPWIPRIADLNRDGRLDLAVVNGGQDFRGSVSVFLGDGMGGFTRLPDVPAGMYAHGLAVGDLDSDGKPDLAVSNFYSNTVSVLLGNGDGSFVAQPDCATGREPYCVVMGDVDGDGDQDLAVSSFVADSVSVLLGRDDGTFDPRREFATGNAAREVLIRDLDTDGRLDLAVANEGSESVSVLLGIGNGDFLPRTDYAAGAGAYGMAIADLNVDGRPDLAVAHYMYSNTVSVLLNRSRVLSLFGPRVDYPSAVRPWGLAIGDFSRDGRLDVGVANWGGLGEPLGHTASVLLGNGAGGLGAASNFETGRGPRLVATDDFNLDGKLDLATANLGDPPIESTRTASLLLGNGDGTFGFKTDFETSGSPFGIASADLNRDGSPDLVTANGYGTGSNTVSVLLGRGDGTFQPRQDFTTGVWPTGVAIGDVNRDGRLDLVVTNHGASSISVLLGHGDGTFGPKTDFGTAAYPYMLGLADLDRDGRLDIATTCSEAHIVSVLLGNGDGTFQPRSDLEAGHDASGLAIGDLDVDGRLDLAVVCNLSDALLVYLGNGDGSFQPRMLFGTGDYPESVAIGDLNRDGVPDLLVSNFAANTLSVFLNQLPTVPVMVENLEAVAGEGTVHLTWRLSADALQDLGGIRVERGPVAEGPYAARTASPLEPAFRMSFDDVESLGEGTYWYRLVLLLGSGAEAVAGPVSIEVGSGLPFRTALRQPYERAGGGPVQILYSLANERVPVRLVIYDVRGREVWSTAQSVGVPGEHSQSWDRRDGSGTRVSRGVYLIRLEAGDVNASRKLVLMHR